MDKKVSISIFNFQTKYGDKKALQLAKELGADGVDFNLLDYDKYKPSNPYAMDIESMKAYFLDIKKYADELGIKIAQTHGRITGFKNVKEEDDKLIENGELDCIATAFVLISVLVSKRWGLMIDGYVGILVSVMILIAGIRSAKETIDLLLGMPPTKEYIKEITDFLKQYPEIVGTHDIMVHDYGVGRKFVSFHAEVPSDLDINYAHEIIDRAERDMNKQFGALVTIHFDPISVNDFEVAQMRELADECAKAVDPTFTIHDFRMTRGERYTNLIFDLVIPVDHKGSDQAAAERVAEKIKEKNPDYFAVIRAEHPFF
jgi:hypothetical protein